MKKHKGLKTIGKILAVILVFLLVINIIPPKKNVENNPFLVAEGEFPMIAAHRGGGLYELWCLVSELTIIFH